MLRDYIKTIGCGMLQESVWLTSYNPKTLIEDFIKRLGMEENLIIISSIGKDGTVGEMNIKDLIERVFKLEDLNEDYYDFISWVRSEKPEKSHVVSRYLLILKNDPQVPFKLLPDDWVGKEAYELFQSYSKQ